MNKVGEVFNPHQAICREFDVKEIHSYVGGSGLTRAGSWGFRNPTQWKNQMYSFRVSGHHHKGMVNIILDGSDTFTIYYTGVRDKKIKKITEDVYIFDLIEILDKDIERIPEYSR